MMQKEYALARKMARFPGIRQMTIAFADAGVIPYFTEARVIDVVGLNDRFIARERRLPQLVDSVFKRRPDLFILPAGVNGGLWIEFGHGPLGNYRQWTHDRRWDKYTYAGTATTNIYDLHFFVRNDYARQRELREFLVSHVVDLKHAAFPLPIGSRVPAASRAEDS
jgi:hypothetical protein